MFNHEPFEDFFDYIPTKQLALADVYRDATTARTVHRQALMGLLRNAQRIVRVADDEHERNLTAAHRG